MLAIFAGLELIRAHIALPFLGIHEHVALGAFVSVQTLCVGTFTRNTTSGHTDVKIHVLYTTSRHIPPPDAFPHIQTQQKVPIVSHAHDKTPGTVGFDFHNQPIARCAYQKGGTIRWRFVFGS